MNHIVIAAAAAASCCCFSVDGICTDDIVDDENHTHAKGEKK